VNEISLAVRPRAPFAFDLALAYLRSSPSTIVETITDDAYRRPLLLNGRPALLEVRVDSSDGPESTLAVVARGEAIGEADRCAVERLARRAFATDVDLADLNRTTAADPVFAAVVERCRGLRPVLIPDVFETIVWAIIGQQITVQFAGRCKRALVERYGVPFRLDGLEYRLFPPAERLAEARPEDLQALQYSRQKIRYILNLARLVATGELDLDALWDLPAEEAIARLQQITGIGRWTAEYVLLRGLGHRDMIPAADGGLRRIIGRAYGLGRSASEEEVRQRAEAWAGWRGYAAFYWWFTLQQEARGRMP
jgi:DNA-3-methyladenine glycosylase II